MEVADIITSVVEPANKLIEVVSSAIGKAYEPRYRKRLADAKAYEIRTIGEEIRNNSDLPIICDTNGLASIDISDYDELVKRTGKRIAYQEVVKQENIEAIVGDAYEELLNEKVCAEGEISREWIHRFIDSAGDISTEEMQKIWSKVLSGEVLAPSSFSLRTLECLRNMDVHDAHLFKELCTVVIENRFVLNDIEFLREKGLSYDSILKLDEVGLINSSGTISCTKELGEEINLVVDFGDYILMGSSDEKLVLSISEFPLTTAGRELCSIVGEKVDIESIKKVSRIIANKNKKAKFTLHKVNYREIDSVDYEEEPIKFMDNEKTEEK